MSLLKKVPWTKEEVELLREYQEQGLFHPYTCDCRKNLIPTKEGWICDCGYTQDWVLQSTLDWLFKRKELVKNLQENEPD